MHTLVTSLENIHQRFGEKIAYAGVVLMVCLLGYSVINIAADFIPKKVMNDDFSQPVLPAPKPLTNLTQLHFLGAYAPKTIDPNALPEATLALKLLGVFAAEPESLAQAVIEDQEGIQHIYRVGQALPGGASISKIYRNSVIIDFNGRLERLSLQKQKLKFNAPLESLTMQEDSGFEPRAERPSVNKVDVETAWRQVLIRNAEQESRRNLAALKQHNEAAH